MTALEILAKLIGFKSITNTPNAPIIDWVEAYLQGLGFAVHRIARGEKSGLFARIGPAGDGGILLSGHSDVVPVEGQNWQRDPFALTRAGDRVFGRGTTDMKGFLAVALAIAAQAAHSTLRKPLMLAISYDEEIGCRGIAAMIGQMIPTIGTPELVIVGEPTGLRLALGHKGKAAYRAICHGTAGHSAMAPQFQNALHLAADFLGVLRKQQLILAETGARDMDYDIPYATIHAGRMQGGIALNIVPDRAEIDFEIRHLATQTAADLLAPIAAHAAEISAGAQKLHPIAAIEIIEISQYPGLASKVDNPAVMQAAAALSGIAPIKVSYGTEAGFFTWLGLPTIVWGPGDMAQAHQPDEYIEIAQLAECEARLAQLILS